MTYVLPSYHSRLKAKIIDFFKRVISIVLQPQTRTRTNLGSPILSVPSLRQTMASLASGMNCASQPQLETRKHTLM